MYLSMHALSKMIFVGLALLLSGTVARAESLLIKHVQIVSGDRPQVLAAQDVLVRDGKIVAIGRRLGRADKQIDGKAKFLIPGLIDTHVHLDGVPGYVGHDAKDAPMLNEARQQMPRSYAYFGFTTVLDLTGDSDFISAWNAQPIAPRAFFCAPVTLPNAYPAVWLEADAQFKVPASKYMLFDPAQPNVYPASFQREAHTPEQVVLKAKQDGASCIKVFYETGFGPKRNLPVPALAFMQAVLEQAHKLGLPVYLHGNSPAAYQFALDVGVDTLVHGMWHEAKAVDALANQEKIAQLAKAIAKAGIAIQPTVQVLFGEQEELNPQFFDHPLVQHAIPQQLAQWYQSAAGQWMKRVLAEGIEAPAQHPAELYAAAQRAYQKPLATVRSMTRQLRQDGATLRFGSDTPSGPFYTQFPGINGRWEMDRWLEMGIGLKELFSAMTIGNAQALGMQDVIGAVKVGARADLLLLEKNPLLTVEAYDTIDYVILNGQAHQRKSLSAMALQTTSQK